MTDLILTTFDWVPEAPRGYVRDIRVRWALEEAGLPDRVSSVTFRDRDAEHFSHQPFKSIALVGESTVAANEDNTISIGDMIDANGKPKRWREVAPMTFRDINGQDSVIFRPNHERIPFLFAAHGIGDR